jgi:predicted metal-dependent hydrolase
MIKNLHPDDFALYCEAVRLAKRLASSIGKEIKIFEAKRRPAPCSAIGLCYYKEKRIAITFRYRHYKQDGGRWWPQPLEKKTIMETVAHEVAHLVHPDHGKEFRELEKELIAKI